MEKLANNLLYSDTSTGEYLKLFRKLKKAEKQQKRVSDKQIKIAVLSSTSMQFFIQVLYVQLVSLGYQPEFYEGTFGNVITEVLDDESELYSFKPNYVLIFEDYKILNLDLQIFQAETDTIISEVITRYQLIWEKLTTKLSCEIFQSNFVMPLERVYEQLESELPFSMNTVLNKINNQIIEATQKNVHIVDLHFLAMKIGLYNWYDEKNFYLSKIGFNYEYIPQVTKQFINKINAINGHVKKAIVLDLDNTLWGGVIGDDGIQGIKLGNNSAEGEAFVAFQEYLLKLKNRGILLAICSKNEEVAAKIPFIEHQEMVLSLDDIACFKANWQDKATNIKEIATELNLGLDSFVFVDDNPAERLIVKEYLPEVTVVNLSDDPALYIRDLAEAQLFDWSTLTKEDIMRNDSYINNVKRQQLANTFVDYQQYLQSLEMKGTCRLVMDNQVERFSQLTQKSNQFNLRTIRYTENEIEQLRKDDDYLLFAVTLEDKFSQYGLIACIILKRQSANRYFIENWLMSCRVLKRQVEEFTLNKIIKHLKKLDVEFLDGEYIPSAKNKLVVDFYRKLGFTEIEKNHYSLNIK